MTGQDDPGRARWSREHAQARDEATDRSRAERRPGVRDTASAAATSDPLLAPDALTAAAERCFRAIQDAWSRDDRATLRRLVAPALMTEWNRLLDDFAARGWRNEVTVRSVDVEYIDLREATPDGAPRVVVRISAILDDAVRTADGEIVPHVGNPTPETHLREYWTLEHTPGGLVLVSIEQDEEGAHHLTADAPSPAVALTADDPALAETGLADAVVALYAAWARAVDEGPRVLAELTVPGAAGRMLHPHGPDTRLVLRGTTVTAVDARTDGADVRVRVAWTGVRYLQDRATAVVRAGDDATPRHGEDVIILTEPPRRVRRVERLDL